MIDETGVFGCGGTILGENARAVLTEKGSKRTWATICYTDEAQRKKLKEISEFTASIFDEIILDDFYLDQWHSIQNLAYWMEQAFHTYFAKGRELTLFCYSWLVDTIYIPPLGHELEHLDAIIGETGNPVGIPVYEPHHAYGEDHLYDYLGMAGLPFEPRPTFPDTDSLILLTANSGKDTDVIEKMNAHLLKGGDICITSGFLKVMQGKGIERFTSAFHTGRKAYARDYFTGGMGSLFNSEYSGRNDVLLPVVSYMNNSADCLIGLRKHDNNFPVLLRNWYGKGTIYTLVVPDDYADIYKFPIEVLTTIRQYLMSDLGIYAECADKVGIFLYDNKTFILESFQDRANKIRVHIYGGGRKLIDLKTGTEISAYLRKENESIFEIPIMPVFYRVFKIV